MDALGKVQIKPVFFLGGADLEMATIRALLDETVPGNVHDKGLRWGAKASAYREEIMSALAQGLTPVLVELEDNLGPHRRGPRLALPQNRPRAPRQGQAAYLPLAGHGRRGNLRS